MGYVARELIPTMLARTEIALFPYADSLVTRSKQSIKLLELMASGCAVIASDVGDIATSLGSTGELVPNADPVVFAEQTARLLACRDTIRERGAAASARVRSRFVVPVVAERLHDVYRSLGIVS
jgi:glycosyltransferase involved in cell wall biosynthesis